MRCKRYGAYRHQYRDRNLRIHQGVPERTHQAPGGHRVPFAGKAAVHWPGQKPERPGGNEPPGHQAQF